MLRSEEVNIIRKEVDAAGCDMYDAALRFKSLGDEYKHKIARMAHSHLLNAYLELMNVIDLIEVLEETDE